VRRPARHGGFEEMRQLPDLSFEAWIAYVFDHPITDQMWHMDSDRDYWDELRQPSTTVSYLTRALEDAAAVLAPFSDAQLEQGLWFLVSTGYSSHMLALLEPSVPRMDRERGILSMFHLFEQLFLPRCVRDHLSHLDRDGRTASNPLNTVCYMWWDILPIGGSPATPALAGAYDACLQVMQQTLTLESDACRESALHGLGHWHAEYPQRVETMIDSFLQAYEPRRKRGKRRGGPVTAAPVPLLRPELRAYALSARQGCVL
jgi:hypothetical protein